MTYDDKGNIVSMIKLNTLKFPSHRWVHGGDVCSSNHICVGEGGGGGERELLNG